jgi:hypothetical protein
VNSQIHIYTGYNNRITHKSNKGVGEKKLPKKGENNRAGTTTPVNGEH